MIKKISLILLFLTLHLTISLKSTDFCIPKQQKECKGYYDRHKKYQIKCNTIKCHGKFSYDCGSDICSNNMNECKKYNYRKMYSNNAFRMRIVLTSPTKQLSVKNSFKLFTKQLKECEYRIYKFDSNDFCLNGKDCKMIHRYRHKKIIKQIDCQCPNEQSFKCEKYCTIDSLACDFYKSKENKQYFQNITLCGNHDITTFKTNFNFLVK
jgi:hypothetical protein